VVDTAAVLMDIAPLVDTGALAGKAAPMDIPPWADMIALVDIVPLADMVTALDRMA